MEGSPFTRIVRSLFMIAIVISCISGVKGTCRVVCGDICDPCLPEIHTCAGLEVYENTPIGMGILNISVDPDASELRLTGTDASYFGLEGKELIVNDTIDSEVLSETVEVTVDCRQTPTESWSGSGDSLQFPIRVLDENEYTPAFESKQTFGRINENAITGEHLVTDQQIWASDQDFSENQLKYSIVENDVPFSISGGICQEGAVTLQVDGNIDYETNPYYILTILAQDGCAPVLAKVIRNDTMTAYIEVVDVDELPPIFSESVYEVVIPEMTMTVTYQGIVAFDQDRAINATLQYSFIGQSGDWGCSDYLQIDSDTAEISIIKELDFEIAMTPCNITLQAVQQDNCMMVAESTLTVTVTDVNECPSFMEDTYRGQISSDDPFLIRDGGSERLIIGATDDDLIFKGNFSTESDVNLVPTETPGSGQTVYYFIKLDDPTSLNGNTQIQLSVFDPTTEVSCQPSVTNVTIRLMSDGLAPNFTQVYYYGNVKEDDPAETTILTVSVSNSAGTSKDIVYNIQLASDGGDRYFAIDPASGEISVFNAGLDAESVIRYTIVVEAVDESGTYYRSSLATVIIDILDANEYGPVFSQDTFDADMEEEIPAGSAVLTVQASDLDVNSSLIFSIDEGVPFSIDGTTGEIATSERLNRDDPETGQSSFNFTVYVTDGQFENTSRVIITLLDINDNPPVFDGEPFVLDVPENITDAVTYNVSATDADEGINGRVSYTLESPTGDDRFSLENETGIISINGPFDYEDVTEYSLVVMATDGKFIVKTTVTVSIIDVNDNAPVFTLTYPPMEVAEDVPVDQLICSELAEDADENGDARVAYSIDESTGAGRFKIDDSGGLRIAQELDREANDTYNVLDPYKFSMNEHAVDSSDCDDVLLGVIQSNDADSAANSNVFYETDNPDFEVRDNRLRTVACIRRDRYSRENILTITAINIGYLGERNQSSSTNVSIIVEDVNDHTPEFTNDNFEVETSELNVGDVLWEAEAQDEDEGPYNNATIFRLDELQENGAVFMLFDMSRDGILSVYSDVVPVIEDMYRVNVVVSDEGSPPLSSSATVSIFVGNFESDKPYFPTSQRTQPFVVPENDQSCIPFDAPRTCNDTHSAMADVEYSLDVTPDSGEGSFSVNDSLPALCIIGNLDREESPFYSVQVTAVYADSSITCTPFDSRRKRATTGSDPNVITFNVTVSDVIDSPPVLQFPSNRSRGAYYLAAIDSTPFRTTIFTVTATDADENPKLQYNLSRSTEEDIAPGNNIVIDTMTGQIQTDSLLYTQLSETATWMHPPDPSLTEDYYTVSVCDVGDGHVEIQCEQSFLTFKILLSYEHIIIHLDETIDEVKGQQDTLISCIADTLDLDLYLQFLSPQMNIPDNAKADMWLYAVDPTRSEETTKYLTFTEFKASWDRKSMDLDTCHGDMVASPLRLSSVRPGSNANSLEAWLSLTLAVVVFIGNLIGTILLCVSWRQLMMEGGQHISQSLRYKEHIVEKGFINPTFEPGQDLDDRSMTHDVQDHAYDAVEAQEEPEAEREPEAETEPEEDDTTTGSEEPVITKVCVTDGKTTTMVALTEGDAPKNVEELALEGAVDADAHEYQQYIVISSLPVNNREYETVEETMDVYPFDKSDELDDNSPTDTAKISDTNTMSDTNGTPTSNASDTETAQA